MTGARVMRRLAWGVPVFWMAIALVSAACASQEQAAPTATSAPAAQPTATAAPVATPTRAAGTPTPTAAPAGPTGTLTVVGVNVGTPLFLNSKATWPINRFHWAWGVTETLATLEPETHSIQPMVAESWQVSPDLTKVTVKVRRGIQFHKGWGELTAEDVAWNYNDAGADNLQSVHDDAGEFSDMYRRWTAIDQYTAEGPIDIYRFDIELMSLTQGGSAPSLFSKKVFDQVGAEAAVTTLVGTGPFEAREWKADEVLQAEAVPNHWRKTPGFKTLRVLEIPEASARVAMMETGEADIGDVPLKDVGRLKEKGLESIPNGAKNIPTAWMAGNYWQKKGKEGNPLPRRPGFKPDDQHPWIGDPDNPERMERARKVRLAMSLAVDRQAIVDTVLGGFGTPAYVPGFYTNDPVFEERWKVPFDVAQARQLLREAGYGNGFKFTAFIPPDAGFPEAAEAVVSMWGNIGLQADIERTSYSVRRPTEVNREIDIPWFFLSNHDKPLNEFGNLAYPFAQPGWNPGYEAQEEFDSFVTIARTADRQQRIELIKKIGDFRSQWVPGIAIAEVPVLSVYNPRRVTGWKPHFEVTFPATINNLEMAVPAQ